MALPATKSPAMSGRTTFPGMDRLQRKLEKDALKWMPTASPHSDRNEKEKRLSAGLPPSPSNLKEKSSCLTKQSGSLSERSIDSTGDLSNAPFSQRNNIYNSIGEHKSVERSFSPTEDSAVSPASGYLRRETRSPVPTTRSSTAESRSTNGIMPANGILPSTCAKSSSRPGNAIHNNNTWASPAENFYHVTTKYMRGGTMTGSNHRGTAGTHAQYSTINEEDKRWIDDDGDDDGEADADGNDDALDSMNAGEREKKE